MKARQEQWGIGTHQKRNGTRTGRWPNSRFKNIAVLMNEWINEELALNRRGIRFYLRYGGLLLYTWIIRHYFAHDYQPDSGRPMSSDSDCDSGHSQWLRLTDCVSAALILIVLHDILCDNLILLGIWMDHFEVTFQQQSCLFVSFFSAIITMYTFVACAATLHCITHTRAYFPNCQGSLKTVWCSRRVIWPKQFANCLHFQVVCKLPGISGSLQTDSLFK